MLPQTSAPPNEHMKNVFRKWPFSHQKCDQNWPQKKLWLDIYVEKRVWAKKSAKLVIPVRSTFQNDLHPPIGGHHPVLYFTTHVKKKYCTAMCYQIADYQRYERKNSHKHVTLMCTDILWDVFCLIKGKFYKIPGINDDKTMQWIYQQWEKNMNINSQNLELTRVGRDLGIGGSR